MRRIALGLAIAVVVCLTARAHGQDIYDCYNGSAEQGGNRTTTNGIQSLQYVQQSFPNAQVDVYLHNTTTHATIFQDGAGTVPLSNPFSASAHGVAFVCAADGRYDFKYSLGGITTPFTVSDIKFCFNCSGGGGGGGLSGTPNQVIKFGTATTGVNSSGGPDDGVHVVPWTNGLSIENASLDKQRPNGTNCTTSNLLVEYDGNTIANVASVQTAALSSQHVIGVADQGAGCSGSVRIADHGYHACIFDNQTTIHDAVIASASVAGECSDGGGSVQGTQVVGRVASVNTGPGTVATVDWFTGDTQQAAGTISSCATGGSNAYFPGIGQVVSCDPLIKDDGNGGLTFNNPAYAGFSYKKQGPLPPATPTNTIMEASPTSVTTQTLVAPGTTALVGQTRVVDTITTDANGNPIYNMKWGTAGGGGVEAQTNGTDNANCTAGVCPLVNAQSGLGVTVTNPSGGVWNYALAGATQLATPTAPTLTVNGTPGSTTITYKVVAVEDPYSVYHTAASAATTTTTANGTLSSSNSVTLTVYGDTLYGARCFNIYRTATNGTSPTTTGLIASCVGKTFTDTGLAGDSSTAPSTNNTILQPHMAALPTANIPPFGLIGVDAPPSPTNALDDEFGENPNSGVPGDVNNTQWKWFNQESATATYSNGSLVLVSDTSAAHDLEGLYIPLPGSTPYTFKTFVDVNTKNGTESNCGIGFQESSTGKIMMLSLLNNQGASSGSANLGVLLIVRYFTNFSSYSTGTSVWFLGYQGENGGYLQLQNDGTNINVSFSPASSGIAFPVVATIAKTTPFTTGPNRLLLVATGNSSSATTCTFDFERRTQ